MTRRDGHTRTRGGEIPETPGWWIQWCRRDRWRRVSPDFAAWAVDQLIDGERVVHIEAQKETVE